MAEMMQTNQAISNRLLDPENTSITLKTIKNLDFTSPRSLLYGHIAWRPFNDSYLFLQI